jgi:hypothetical protein
MAKTIPPFEEGFQAMEEAAKNPDTLEGNLSLNLAMFMKNVGYRKSPFNLEFSSLVRGRSVTAWTIEEAMHEFRNVSRLSHPPKATNPKASRCNAEGEPAFYCAGDTGIPIFELRSELYQYVVLAFFVQKGGRIIQAEIPIIGSEHIYKNLKKRDPKHPLLKILKQDIHFKKDDRDETTITIDRRLAQWFSEPVTDDNKHIYRLTNAYYDMLKTHMNYDGKKLKGLLYPSIESESSGFNVVFDPDWVDENLMVSGATIYRVVRKNQKYYSLAPLKTLKVVKGNGETIWDDYLWEIDPGSPSVVLL